MADEIVKPCRTRDFLPFLDAMKPVFFVPYNVSFRGVSLTLYLTSLADTVLLLQHYSLEEKERLAFFQDSTFSEPVNFLTPSPDKSYLVNKLAKKFLLSKVNNFTPCKKGHIAQIKV